MTYARIFAIAIAERAIATTGIDSGAVLAISTLKSGYLG